METRSRSRSISVKLYLCVIMQTISSLEIQDNYIDVWEITKNKCRIYETRSYGQFSESYISECETFTK